MDNEYGVYGQICLASVFVLSFVCDKFTESFVVSGNCFFDTDCGLGKCDIDNQCRCYLGWKGDHCGEHDDLALGTVLNPCDHYVCQHGTCHSYGGERKCRCDYKWHGIVCDIPFGGHAIWETTTRTTTSRTTNSVHMTWCGNHFCYHGRCHGYQCQCDHGWSGSNCDNNVYLCNQGNCHHGDCIKSKCYCHAGWSGSTCNDITHTYVCDGQPCHHGNCEWASGGRQYCRCYYGWTGHDCNTEESASYSRCGSGQNTITCAHGSCQSSHNYGYYHSGCQCDLGWRGASCNEIHPRCFDRYCYHGECHHDISRSDFYCICNDGWTGRDCNKREIQSTPTTTSTTTTTTTTLKPTTATSTTMSSTIPTTTSPKQPTSTTTSSTIPTTTKATTTTTTAASTTVPTKTMSTTPLTTQTPLNPGVCSKLSTVSDIANVQISTNQNAVSCISGNKTSPEALVLTHCNLTSPTKWKEGINVMKDCSAIKPYTPIATFGNHHYSSAGTLCGIFVGCLQNGFQMAVQYCDQPPSIEHVETNNGLFARDPTTYYTVME